MSRLLIFLLVVLSIVAGVHFYLWARLVRDTQLPLPVRPWVTALLIALAVSLPATFILLRRVPPEWGRLLAWPGFVWMGLMFLTFTLVLAGDIVRLLLFVGSKVASEGLDPGRLMLARLLGGGAAAGAGLVGALALRRALARVEVKEVAVRLAKLPAARNGTTIVQLTDLHVGPTIGRAFIEDIVRRTNELRPDVIAITGDLVDGSVERLRHAVEPLRDLRAPHGVYFVTGNHEYFSGAGPWLAELRRLGIRVLRNERVALGEGADAIDLAGIDDHSAGRLGEAPSDLGRALEGRDPTRPVILLAHQPRAVLEASELGVDLQLSGHTHGGQIWPFTYLVKLQQPYVAGLHQHGPTQIYVSPGTGYWGPPMRLGTRAEITRVTLHTA